MVLLYQYLPNHFHFSCRVSAEQVRRFIPGAKPEVRYFKEDSEPNSRWNNGQKNIFGNDQGDRQCH